MSPTMYINDMYEHYSKTEDLQEVLKTAAKAMDEARSCSHLKFLRLVRKMQRRILYSNFNTLQNEDMLRDTPHRNFRICRLFIAG